MNIITSVEKFFKNFLPSPFSIAILLTLLTILFAYIAQSNESSDSILEIVQFWERGIWDKALMVFALQMMLMLVLGYSLALDFITLHIPKINDKPFIGRDEFDIMKKGVGIINTSRGGLIDESELIKFLNNKKVSFAALDVYENEPTPNIQLLMHDKISLSAHIGGSTVEAQEKIGDIIVKEIKSFYKINE